MGTRTMRRAALHLVAAGLLLTAVLTPAVQATKYQRAQVFFFSTTDLLLAYSATANAWYPVDLQGGEKVRGGTYSGRVVVVATDQRILGFSSVTNRWAELSAIPNEEFLQVDAQDDVGWVITSLRSLGFSALTGAWAEESLFYQRGGGY